MTQLTLFSSDENTSTECSDSRRPDDDSCRLLIAFEEARVHEGAHPRSAQREVSQLRALLREARSVSQGATLRALFTDLGLLARLLREPATVISRSTGRVRLLAVQRFIRIIGQELGRDPAVDLVALDALLPTRRSTGWHTTGTLVAGAPGRRRRRGPTLDAADLRRLVDAAGAGPIAQAPRDRALVALHCFSGLRPEEIVRLRWEDLSTEMTASGHYGLTATVERGGRHAHLLLPGPASDAVEALAGAAAGSVEFLTGPVFCAHGASGQPLSYRAARDVLQDAFRRAGLPTVESVALRAACAHWLRSQGLSDHEVAAVLGLAKVRSVDRLLRHHAALDAQRTVREILAR
jgi:integrase